MVFNGSGGNEIMAATANFGRVSFTRNLGGIVMDLNDVEAIDVNALGGTDSVTVNDMSGTDLRRVDVDLAGALGGSAGDGEADTVRSTARRATTRSPRKRTGMPSTSAAWPPSSGSPTRTPTRTR